MICMESHPLKRPIRLQRKALNADVLFRPVHRLKGKTRVTSWACSIAAVAQVAVALHQRSSADHPLVIIKRQPRTTTRLKLMQLRAMQRRAMQRRPMQLQLMHHKLIRLTRRATTQHQRPLIKLHWLRAHRRLDVAHVATPYSLTATRFKAVLRVQAL